jgi:hypothetical protein
MQVVHLDDGEMVTIDRKTGYKISTLKGIELSHHEIVELEGK